MEQQLKAPGVIRAQIHPSAVQIPPNYISQYGSWLRLFYCSKKLPTNSKWPPTASERYINLAMIKKERVSKQEADEFTKAMTHGKIDGIYEQKKAIDFANIGKKEDGSPTSLILVEGVPGIGKTTFAWELCRKWAEREILQEYKLVLLFSLDNRRLQKAKTVSDLFYHLKPQLNAAVRRNILDRQGKSVLLLYEGYNELPRKLQEKQSIFLDILHKRYLSLATILITSRPSATGYLHWKFRNQISQHIQILGFTHASIISYVHSVMKNEDDFLQYLNCHPHVREVMYVPLNAVIVTEVYKGCQHSPEKFIPITMTELYTALTQSTLLRYMINHGEFGQQKLENFKGLPIELYEQFCHICALAVKGIIEGEFMFMDLPNDFNTLDLMQSVPELRVERGPLVSHNFIHSTLQEYLAAVYISQQTVEKQIEFLRASQIPDPSTSPISEPNADSSLNVGSKTTATMSSRLHLPHDPIHPPLQPSMFHQHFPPTPQYFVQVPPYAPMQPFSSQYHPLNPDAKTFSPHHQYYIPHMQPFIVYRPMPPLPLPPVSEWPPHSQPYPVFPFPTQDRDVQLESTFPPFSVPPSTAPPAFQFLHPPHPTMVPPIPGMTHPYHSSDFGPQGLMGGGAERHSSEALEGCSTPIIPHDVGRMSPTSLPRPDSLPLDVTPTDQPHWFESPDETQTPTESDIETISVSSITEPWSRSLSTPTQLMLPDIYIDYKPGIATKLINVLRFVAGLTKLKDIPVTSLQPLILEHQSEGEATITLNALYWLFEAQDSDIYNEIVSSTPNLRFYTTPTMSSFDYFVLGYAVSHITCHWKINLSGIGNSDVDMLQAGMNFDKTNLPHFDFSVHLDLSECKITHEGLSHLTRMPRCVVQNITNLSLKAIELGDGGTATLAKVLKENRSLQQLDISQNSIGQKGATTLAEVLKKNRTLKLMDVSHNSIGQEGAIALAEVLKENKVLQKLDISTNSIGRGGATALAEALTENKTLQWLNIRFNCIGQMGAVVLAEMLKVNISIQWLNISNNSIRREGASALAEMLKENKILQQLIISSNSIGQGGATALAEMLKENRTLQQLDISANSIDKGGATVLAEVIEENTTLQCLNISFNSIGQRGATALAEMLEVNRTLQQLDIGCTDIGEAGATTVAKPLHENQTLQSLCISNNSIQQRGVIAIAEILKENRMLRELDISRNFITQQGTIALAEMLKKNKTLQLLDISYNNSMSHNAVTALAEMLKENGTLNRLNVVDYSIGEEGVHTLVESLDHNSTLEKLTISEKYRHTVPPNLKLSNRILYVS